MMEQAGAAAVAVHGRTHKQMYAGEANWDYIRAVKEAVTVPVIANGDVFTPEPPCASCATPARTWPWWAGVCLVTPGSSSSAPPRSPGRDPHASPAGPAVRHAVRRLINAAHKGEKIACLEARRHSPGIFKSVPYAGYSKEQISKISTMEDIYKVTEGIRRDLR